MNIKAMGEGSRRNNIKDQGLITFRSPEGLKATGAVSKMQRKKQRPGACVLMFSGGRDSSIAALRLVKRYSKVILVTVTSDHLFGIETVYQRLSEIKRFMPESAEWYCVKQPASLLTDVTFYAPTCLPCHHSYVVLGSLLAEQNNIKDIAFAYAGYQAAWPEQTSYSIKRLKGLLNDFGFNLILPVRGIST